MRMRIPALLSCLLLSFVIVFADNAGPGDIPVTPIDPNSPRPRTPNPTCLYDGQWLTINFPISEGIASVEIDDGINSDQYEYDTSLPIIINVGTLTSGAIITIETGIGNTYIGTFI